MMMMMSIEIVESNRPCHIGYVYQPMWNIDKWNVFGYEALIGNPEPSIISEDSTSLRVKQEMVFKQNTRLITAAIECFPFHHLNHALLFIKLYPSTLLHVQFNSFIHQLLNQFPQCKGKIVFELMEMELEEHIWRSPELKEKISLLKENEFRIAITGIGVGGSTLAKIMQIEPNYIILDRSFSHQLYTSKEKQKVISILVKYANNKMGIILEGMDRELDLATAKLLRVPLVLGQLFGAVLKARKTIS
jgi:EAL domain-containing protein (putative c-di-GMP-specific phosphodiesterase class I)